MYKKKNCELLKIFNCAIIYLVEVVVGVVLVVVVVGVVLVVVVVGVVLVVVVDVDVDVL